jgi:hypothetical protein
VTGFARLALVAQTKPSPCKGEATRLPKPISASNTRSDSPRKTTSYIQAVRNRSGKVWVEHNITRCYDQTRYWALVRATLVQRSDRLRTDGFDPVRRQSAGDLP